jgi:predicted Zn-dependent protease with MMP-like domain
MNQKDRTQFDLELEQILAELPGLAKTALAEIPLIVEDYPAANVLREQEIEFREELCGLFVGISKLEASVDAVHFEPNRIYLFREGIMEAARTERGTISRSELRKQIRITLLHEIGHFLGMTEDELEELGYG